MKYQEFLDYIYQRHSGNVKLGLDRMLNILDKMGNPNKKLRGIHIAGTNGKGSTAAICEALSLEYGIKTGLNTSPHLVDYRERIRVNGKNIKLYELIKSYKKWQPIFEKNEASFFEITTSMAFYYFIKNKVENAIFEVGLGGRLDGTNPFTPTVSVITTISYDHTKSLGNALEKIAYEKAGIIKKNTPLILGKMDKIASEIIKKIAEEKDAPIYEFEKDFNVSNISFSESGTEFDFKSRMLNLEKLSTNLIGRHQAYNSATAIMTFLIFLEEINKTIDTYKIRKALRKVNWQGRMEILSKTPLVLIDGAHNEEAIKCLSQNLKELFPDKKIYFVMAILRDKNLKSIIKNICDVSYKIYISKNKSTRAAEIEDQVKFVQQDHNNYEIISDVVKATQKAISEAQEEDVIVISGSLYTISEVLKAEEYIFNV